MIAHFTEHSSILYRAQDPNLFLSIFIKFRPLSPSGLLLTFTGIPLNAVAPTRAPPGVLVDSKMRTEAERSKGREFVRVSLVESGHVMVDASLNGSDMISMQAGRIHVSCVGRFLKLRSCRYQLCQILDLWFAVPCFAYISSLKQNYVFFLSVFVILSRACILVAVVEYSA